MTKKTTRNLLVPLEKSLKITGVFPLPQASREDLGPERSNVLHEDELKKKSRGRFKESSDETFGIRISKTPEDLGGESPGTRKGE